MTWILTALLLLLPSLSHAQANIWELRDQNNVVRASYTAAGLMQVGTLQTSTITVVGGGIMVNGTQVISASGAVTGAVSGNVNASQVSSGSFQTGNYNFPAGDALGISTAAAFSGLFQVGNATLTVLQSGNVGIGTANPQATLDVNGTLNNNGLQYTDPSGNTSALFSQAALVTFYGGGPGFFTGAAANGTAASPSATLNGNQLASFGGKGHNGTAGTAGFTGTSARMVVQAAENWTTSANGAQLIFQTVPTGSLYNQRNTRMTIGANGDVTISTNDVTIANGHLFVNAGANANPDGFYSVQNAANQQWLMVSQNSSGNFLVTDQTHASVAPFEIEPRAPTGSLYIKGSGNIGVQTTAPNAALEVSSPAAGGTTNPVLIVSTGTAAGQRLLSVLGNGNVGIGTSAPAAVLNVVAAPTTSAPASALIQAPTISGNKVGPILQIQNTTGGASNGSAVLFSSGSASAVLQGNYPASAIIGWNADGAADTQLRLGAVGNGPAASIDVVTGGLSIASTIDISTGNLLQVGYSSFVVTGGGVSSVGINTISPLAALDVEGASGANYAIKTSSGISLPSGAPICWGSSCQYSPSSGGGSSNGSSGQVQYSNGSGGFLGAANLFYNSGTGYVGVSTTSPSSPFHTLGNNSVGIGPTFQGGGAALFGTPSFDVNYVSTNPVVWAVSQVPIASQSDSQFFMFIDPNNRAGNSGPILQMGGGSNPTPSGLAPFQMFIGGTRYGMVNIGNINDATTGVQSAALHVAANGNFANALLVSSADAKTNLFSVRGDNGYVGVSTTSPASPLHVVGNDAAGAGVTIQGPGGNINGVLFENYVTTGAAALGMSAHAISGSSDIQQYLAFDPNSTLGNAAPNIEMGGALGSVPAVQIYTSGGRAKTVSINTNDTQANVSSAALHVSAVNSVPYVLVLSSENYQTNYLVVSENGGNVGIGTTSPAAKLDVEGVSGGNYAIVASSGIQINGGAGLCWGSNCQYAPSSGGGGSPGGSSGQVQFNNAGSFGGATNLFYNNATGYVGVSTSAPVSPLAAVGNNAYGIGPTFAGTGINLLGKPSFDANFVSTNAVALMASDSPIQSISDIKTIILMDPHNNLNNAGPLLQIGGTDGTNSLTQSSQLAPFQMYIGGSRYGMMNIGNINDKSGGGQSATFHVAANGNFANALLISSANATTDLLVVRGDNGNVGISTDAPAAALDVENSGANEFMVGGSTLVVTNGFVGIGTTNPTNALAIYGAASNVKTKLSIGTNGGTSMLIVSSATNTGGWKIEANGGGGTGDAPAGTFSISQGNVGAWLTVQNDTGNVGISTPTPGSKLDVEGATAANYAIQTSSGILLGGGGICWGAGNCQYAPASGGVPLSITVATITSPSGYSGVTFTTSVFVASGNVGIGTANPNNLLQIPSLINFDNTNFNTFIGSATGVVNQGNPGLGQGGVNTAVGYEAFYFNTTGSYNTAVGDYALYSNTSGVGNTAAGQKALLLNTSGQNNTASGTGALHSNTTGSNNTGTGGVALYNNTGSNNTAVGYATGYNTGLGGATTLSNSTLVGYQAGSGLTSGSNNVLLGYNAGFAGNGLTTGANNIVIGYNIDAPSPTGSSQLDIGNIIYGTGISGSGQTLSTGNIGIGTATPLAKLDVAGNVLIEAGSVLTSSGIATTAGNAGLFVSTSLYVNGVITGNGSGLTNVAIPNTITSSETFTYSNVNNAGVTISSGLLVQNGLVGIGTSVPNAQLQVNSPAGFSGPYVLSVSTAGTLIFDVRPDGSVHLSSAIFAGGADLAELYPAEPGVGAGDLVALNGDGKLAKADRTSASVFGVVSTKPGTVLGWNEKASGQASELPVALIGRAPVNATLENGPIRRGDRLSASSRPGWAMKAAAGTPVVGVALEDLISGDGAVLTFVKAGDASASAERSDIQDLRRENQELRGEIRELRSLVEKRK